VFLFLRLSAILHGAHNAWWEKHCVNGVNYTVAGRDIDFDDFGFARQSWIEVNRAVHLAHNDLFASSVLTLVPLCKRVTVLDVAFMGSTW
jgi:hypothetical protein